MSKIVIRRRCVLCGGLLTCMEFDFCKVNMLMHPSTHPRCVPLRVFEQLGFLYHCRGPTADSSWWEG